MSLFLEINGQKHTPLEAVRLGQKLYQAGQKREAMIIFSGVQKVTPTNADAHVSAGFCHLDNGNWTEALMCATQARQADPTFLKTYHLALMAMRDHLPTPKTKVWCENGLAHHPNDPVLLLQRAIIHSDVDEHAGVKDCATRILALDDSMNTPSMALSMLCCNFPAREWADLLNHMTIACQHPLMKLSIQNKLVMSLWLRGDRKGATTTMDAYTPALEALKAENNLQYRSETDRRVLVSTMQNVNGYGIMFDRLLKIAAPAVPEEGTPILHMVGDSHVMPQQGQTVTLHGTPHVVESHVSVGVKLWHLGQPDSYLRIRKVVRDILQTLPEGEPVAISVGEIDCRADEGLWPLLLKREKDTDTLLRGTYVPAFAWLKEQIGNRPVIICGIPAPVRSRDHPKFTIAGQHEDYARMVATLNIHMAKAAAEYGWAFADLHALTADKDGLFSTEEWHLEDTHLKPGALEAALRLSV